VAFLDADDLWAPHHLSSLRAITESGLSAGFISTRWAKATGKQFMGTEQARRVEVESIDFFAWCVDHPRYFHTSSVAVRRDVLDAVGGFGRFQPGEDVELFARLALETPCAVARVTTDGRRADEQGLIAKAKIHVQTGDIGPSNLPTPVLRLIDERLRRGDQVSNRRNMERYFDHRLMIGIKAAIRHGDRLRAWKLWQLLLYPLHPRALLGIAVAFVPQRFRSEPAR
jgi:hypothetical protein